jgi:serine/threonine-protein kinase RsbW
MNMPAPASLPQCVMSRSYPGKPDKVRQVRGDLRQVLDGCPIADDVILCASELAANAAVHSNSSEIGTITVHAHVSPGSHVLIQVDDDGGPWSGPAGDPTRGRGLKIVGVLAAHWGITPRPSGRTVWARLDWPTS